MTAYFDRLTHPAGAPNAFSKLFDEMPGVDHVRDWLQKDPQQIWGEHPRGGGQFDSMLSGLARCKYAGELKEDMEALYHSWYRSE
ncbi:hypothetical protein [Polaromonas sp. YR568]|uniref:hypothetical protein n=1 Tax=Polaromonas sp. YR568 TaxID=1855301 RepID=UPI00398BDB1C